MNPMAFIYHGAYIFYNMSDPEKEKDLTKDHYEYESRDSNNNDKSDSSGLTNIKDKIVGKMTSTIGKPGDDNNIYLSESARISNNIRTILQTLFALIGFVILVFAIFAASVRGELVQIATSVFIVAFIAAIVGAFALFGVVVYQIRSGGSIRVKL
jgi:hypothetical protein